MDEFSLGDVIRTQRLRLGLTQEQLAKRLRALGDSRIRQSDISRLEHGLVQLPRRNRLVRLATALDIGIGELMTRAGWIQDEDEPDLPADDDVVEPILDHPEPRRDERSRPERRVRSIVQETYDQHDQFTRNQAEFARMRRLFEQSKREFEEVTRDRGKPDEQ